jgi:serine/threonine protein kinase
MFMPAAHSASRLFVVSSSRVPAAKIIPVVLWLLRVIGTVAYMPKELLLSGRMTQATDIYSFGLMSE